MNAERLLAHYEKIADAPDAIARLRRFILDLAVRGKLVPQDREDEPASSLLKRIASERLRLARSKAIKASKGQTTEEVTQPPFDLPTGWIEAIMAQTTRNQVSIQKQAFFSVSIPPYAEQKRIVAKVDELMALCDHLEASLAAGETARSKLLDALLHDALEPSVDRLEAAA